MKKRILVFCDLYLPGKNGGGGMWSVVNLVDRFNDQYDFFIVTRNFDGRSDNAPYTSVKTDEWNAVGDASVFYFSPGTLTTVKAAEIVREVEPAAVFLNSVFSLPVRRFLSARRNGQFGNLPVVLASCGEMSKAALSIRPFKKKLFLKFAQLFSLYNGVIWKGSFEQEADEIREVMGNDVEVMVAPDLIPRSILPDYSQHQKPKKEPGKVSFVMIARVVPIKNVSYFLECLLDIRDGEVDVEIIGPPEDLAYWERCRQIIERLPTNIRINASGALSRSDALTRAVSSHFFTLPTKNENFGYVFLEALAAGCPLLISDRTVWNDIESKNVGWQLPLDDPNKFIEQIRRCIDMDDVEYSKMSRNAREYALEWLARPEIGEATARVLDRAIHGVSKPITNAH